MMRFHIPSLPWAFALLAAFSPGILPLAVIAWAGGVDPIPLLAPILVLYVAALAFTRYVFTLEITVLGLRLYRVNRLGWEEVTGAEARHVLGVPHLLVRRRRGMPWLVPLYFTGPTNLREQILGTVPAEHPIRSALA